MKLKYIEKHFVLTGSVQEMRVRGGKDIPKAAGFCYSKEGEQPLPKYALWWTDDPSIAVALVRYATDKAKATLHKMDDERRKAIEASCATSAALDVPMEALDEMNPIVFLQGDCREVLRKIEENSIDSVVTDPPYDLKFMGKEWDATGIAFQPEMWKEVLRVLKPGGHLIAMGGTRTHHRLWCAVEDAGFEIRDTLMWLYGSGFPKSLDVSKAIDKAAGAEREVVGSKLGQPGYSLAPDKGRGTYSPDGRDSQVECAITAPATDAARQWDGWGTALKPAWEPILLARKPLIGTVAANVLEYDTGALNVGGCRIEGIPETTRFDPSKHAHDGWRMTATGTDTAQRATQGKGRWPANLVLDEDAAAMLDAQSGKQKSGIAVGGYRTSSSIYGTVTGRKDGAPDVGYGDFGGASRFFYCAKASRKERGEGNNHPTVKPLALMRWLVRLITPPGGKVLDPFVGSGTTALAAKEEGFRCLGIDLGDEYLEIARRRCGLEEQSDD